ncbi:MAG: hypothetical protein ACRDWI_12875 [Jiangellaceae bacterium]
MNVLVPFLEHGFEVMVRSRLRGVWVRGEPPVGPAVWAANHHSWWDPFVAHVLVTRAGRRAALVMDDATWRGSASFDSSAWWRPAGYW